MGPLRFVRSIPSRLLRIMRGQNRRPRAFSMGNRPAPPAPPTPAERTGVDPQGGPVLDVNFRVDAAVSPSLKENERLLTAVFRLPHNSDVVLREFRIGVFNRPALLLYIDGLTKRETINHTILEPLMVLSQIRGRRPAGPVLEVIRRDFLPGRVAVEAKMAALVLEVLDGNTALFIEGERQALLIETKGYEHRAVERPQTELTIRGPKDSFNETLRVNTSLIRRRIKTPNLMVEAMRIGRVTATQVAMVYVEGIANPRLVAEVRRRLTAIDVGQLGDTGELEELIEDAPLALFPQTLPTERPDRVVAFLNEGHVAILVDDSPVALVVPITLTGFIHSPEDYYTRSLYGTFLRILRFAALFITLLLPSIYIAIADYHQEMIPTSLLLAIAASREKVPFPVPAEVVIMELSFELIREAGTRIPTIIGPTIGIVGALILGQAAVQASLVSPITVIVVALTALASSAIPNPSVSLSIRFARFAMIALASILGFLGLAAGLYLLTLHLVTMNSFGVPYLSPVSPFRPPARDVIARMPTYMMMWRPRATRPRDPKRQPRYVRAWAPTTPQAVGDGDGEEGTR